MNLRQDVHTIVSLITSGVIDQEREEIIRTLRALATELNTKQRDMNIAKTSFAASGLVGTGVAIGGAIAAPLTFGASLGLTIAGAAVGVTSCAGGLATAIADHIVNSNAMKEAEAAMARYDEKIRELVDMVDILTASSLQDEEEFGGIVDDEIKFIPNEKEREKLGKFLRGLATRIDTTGHVLHPVTGATLGANAAAADGRSTAVVLGAGYKFFSVGGIVMSFMTVPLDMHTMVTNSIKIHNNTPSAVAEQLNEMAENLENQEILAMEETHY